jgi:hypothetical protein
MSWLIHAILIVGLGCMVGGCSGPVYKHRYRLTLSVETPDGLKSGFSVIEARTKRQVSRQHGLFDWNCWRSCLR